MNDEYKTDSKTPWVISGMSTESGVEIVTLAMPDGTMRLDIIDKSGVVGNIYINKSGEVLKESWVTGHGGK